MKKLIFALLILISSCGSNQENKPNSSGSDEEATADNNLHGTYLIQKIKTENVSSEEFELKFDSIRNEVSGYAGCNRFNSSFEKTGINIAFKPVISTKMYCEGKMEKESEITELFPEISQLVLKEGKIILMNQAQDPLLTIEKLQ